MMTGIPPGPATHPARLLWQWIRRPLEMLQESHAAHGDIFSIRLAMLPGPFVIVADPLAVKEVFALGPEEAHAGTANVVLKPFLGEHSMLVLDGENHSRHRRMILPAFHGDRINAYGRTMIDMTEASLAGWPRGRAFPVHRPMQSITLQVILRTVFGVGAGPIFEDFAGLLAQSLDVLAWPGLLFPVLQRDLGPVTPWAKWLRLRERATRLLRDEIHRAQAADRSGRSDVLAMLLDARDEQGQGLTEDELHDELVTLLVAGHETTATALAWALRFILDDPQLLADLREEIDGADGDPGKIARLELLDATAREALRLQPVIPIVGRELQEPMTVCGWRLPRGTVVAPSIALIHRRPSLYPDPLRFSPRRFFDFKPAPWEFLPFGGGVRRCVGAAFAIHEMKMVLATILARVDLRLARHDTHVVRRSITLTPSDGLPVIASDRHARVRAA